MENADRPVHSDTSLLLILTAAVCAAVLFAHWPALSAEALSADDGQYLVNNPLVQNPSWSSAQRFLTEVWKPSTVKGYYQPLSMISLMLDYRLGGRDNNLTPFHRTSLALHTVNTALIITLLYLLFGNAWAAAAAGLLFGVHPMTVEPIPWVGERKTLLAAFFAICSLIFYVKYAKSRHGTSDIRPQTKKDLQSQVSGLGSQVWYAACLAAYILALLSKPTATALPLMMLILDFWPLRRLNIKAFLEKIPLFVICLISAIITYISQSTTAVAQLPTTYGVKNLFLLLCYNIMFYPCKIVWPVNLSSYYPFPQPFSLSNPVMLSAVIATVTLLAMLAVSLRWTRAAAAGWLFFFAAILPSMQIVGITIVIACDKYAYLPSVGLLMILTFFLGRISGPKSKTYGPIAAVLILLLAAGEITGTRKYLVSWKDSVTLHKHMLSLTGDCAFLYHGLGYSYSLAGRWEDQVKACEKAVSSAKETDSFRCTYYCNLGNGYSKLNRFEEAIAAYKRAITIDPNYAEAYNNLGSVYGELGQHLQEIDAYRQAIKIEPARFEAHYNLGAAYGGLGRFEEAIASFGQAIKIKPNMSDAYHGLGFAYSSLGRWQEAAEHHKEALRFEPDNPQFRYDLGCAYDHLGRYAESIEQYQLAIKLKPQDPEAYYNLGCAYGKLGRYTEAIGPLKKALKLKPDNADAHCNLGHAYSKLGQFAVAAECYKTAIKIKPDYTAAYCGLGMAYGGLSRFADALEVYKQAIKTAPDDAQVNFGLGCAYFFSGDRESAKRQLDTLKKLNGKLAEDLAKVIGGGTVIGK